MKTKSIKSKDITILLPPPFPLQVDRPTFNGTWGKGSLELFLGSVPLLKLFPFSEVLV
jgi:hypothetical protein